MRSVNLAWSTRLADLLERLLQSRFHHRSTTTTDQHNGPAQWSNAGGHRRRGRGVYRGRMVGIGRLGEIVIDCPDPMESAEFYSALTGLPISEDAEDDWVALVNDNGPDIAFQLVEYYEPPLWPSHTSPQRAHLDIYVDDLRRAEREVLRLGAVKCEEQPGRSFTVFLDPAGHPFCLVLEN